MDKETDGQIDKWRLRFTLNADRDYLILEVCRALNKKEYDDYVVNVKIKILYATGLFDISESEALIMLKDDIYSRVETALNPAFKKHSFRVQTELHYYKIAR